MFDCCMIGQVVDFTALASPYQVDFLNKICFFLAYQKLVFRSEIRIYSSSIKNLKVSDLKFESEMQVSDLEILNQVKIIYPSIQF